MRNRSHTPGEDAWYPEELGDRAVVNRDKEEVHVDGFYQHPRDGRQEEEMEDEPGSDATVGRVAEVDPHHEYNV